MALHAKVPGAAVPERLGSYHNCEVAELLHSLSGERLLGWHDAAKLVGHLSYQKHIGNIFLTDSLRERLWKNHEESLQCKSDVLEAMIWSDRYITLENNLNARTSKALQICTAKVPMSL